MLGIYLCNKKNLTIISLAGAVWFFLAFSAASCYPGKLVIYLIFSVIFLAMLLSVFYGRRTYVYIFLVALLWLGFWLKTTWHLIVGTGFPEPTGQFIGTPEQWDQTLIAATFGSAAVLCSKIIFQFLGEKSSLEGLDGVNPRPSILNRRWNLLAFIFAACSISFVNFYYEIFVVGLRVGTVLIWPLNALITLMLVGTGFAVWIAIIIWNELRASGQILYTGLALAFSTIVITSSALSRGMIVNYIVPIIFSMFFNAKYLNKNYLRKVIALFILLFILIAANFFVTTSVRNEIYFVKNSQFISNEVDAKFANSNILLLSKIKGFLNFSIDRWVGIEGLMAVVAYPDVGWKMFKKALVEPAVQKDKALYEAVAPWPADSNSTLLRSNVRFASMPGGLGFLYYSGSLCGLFFITTFVILVLQCWEILIFSLTKNPMICAVIGWSLALMFAHFGGAPKAQLPTIIFIFLLCGLVGIFRLKNFLIKSII